MEQFARLRADRGEGVRVTALVLSLVVTGTTLLQMDRALPPGRLVLGYTALLVLMSQSTMSFIRQRSTWLGSLASGPLIVAGAQALTVHPAAVALALAVIAAHAIYGPLRMLVVRTAGVAAALPTLVALAPLLDPGGKIEPGLAVAPIPVLIMFAALIRVLYGALAHQRESARRQSVLARTSRAEVGASDLSHVRDASQAGLIELFGGLPGLGLLLLRRESDLLIVEGAVGLLDVPVGALLAYDAVKAAVSIDALTPLERAGCWLEDLPGRHAYGMPVGDGGVRSLLITSDSPIEDELRDVVQTLTTQWRLVEANLRQHTEVVALNTRDSLTTIPNRATFFRELNGSVDDPVVNVSGLELLVIDLDDFKNVNDTYGHAAGDLVLVEVARRLSIAAGDGLAARFGGDEFAMLLTGVNSDTSDAVAQDVLERLRRPILWKSVSLWVGASIGIASGATGMSAGDLMRCADVAMYSAKAMGKNRVVRFREAEHGTTSHRRMLEDHVQFALDRQEIVVRYEPIVALTSGRCIAVEAAPWWQHPSLGLLPSSEFMEIAALAGKVAELELYVLATACREVLERAISEGVSGLGLTVGVSPSLLTSGRLLPAVKEMLGLGFPPSRLTIEIIETKDLGKPEAITALAELRRVGVHLSVDRFTAGLLPLAGLKAAAVDRLKIDPGMAGEEQKPAHDDLAMIKGIGALLGLETAERGIGTRPQADRARHNGMTFGQGPLFGPAVSAAELARL